MAGMMLRIPGRMSLRDKAIAKPTPADNDLHQLVMTGQATTEELAGYFGPDLLNQGVHQLRGEQLSRSAIEGWYGAIITPMGFTSADEKDRASRMFTGAITIVDYADGFTEEEADLSCDRYPALQVAYQAKLDAEGMTT